MAGEKPGNGKTAMRIVLDVLGNLPTTEKQGKALKSAMKKGDLKYVETLANTFKTQLLENGITPGTEDYL